MNENLRSKHFSMLSTNYVKHEKHKLILHRNVLFRYQNATYTFPTFFNRNLVVAWKKQ